MKRVPYVVYLFLGCGGIMAQPITFGGCVAATGVPVAAIQAPINDIAQAIPSQNIIRYNPKILAVAQPATRLFFYVHECAHLALPTSNESVADCWAARTLDERKLLDLRTVQADLDSFGTTDWSHVPGRQRAINLSGCLQGAPPRMPDGQSSTRRETSAGNGSCNVSDSDVDSAEIPAHFRDEIGRESVALLKIDLAQLQENIADDRKRCSEQRQDLRKDQDRLDRSQNDRSRASWQESVESDLERIRKTKQSLARDLSKLRMVRAALAKLGQDR